MKSEHGFILVHVAMVAYTGDQVKHTVKALEAVKDDNRAEFDLHLQGMLATLQKINNVMETMWSRSLSDDYAKFRTFIMGTKNQVFSLNLANVSKWCCLRRCFGPGSILSR
jgi:indoleamine 2,3-dioxygenase